MVDRVAMPRAEAIEEFAAALRALRASAGSPSFRTMSGRSHAISHTTLHDAVRGHRLPSWPTTAEFVKACLADPADFRERWEQANQIVRSAAGSPETPAPGESPDGSDESPDGSGASPDGSDASPAGSGASPNGSDAADASPDASPADPVRAPRRWPRLVALAAILAGTLVAGSVVVGVAASSGGNPQYRRGFPSTVRTLTASDCPVQQSNPPVATPPNPGDAGAFIGDITLPDCTHVPLGSTFTKIWRFKNVGTVPWRGYVLHRIDLPQQRDQCQTITDVPIRDTEPGQIVDIEVTVTAPNSPDFCFVRFKMEDASGRIAFPGNRPVNFQVVVD